MYFLLNRSAVACTILNNNKSGPHRLTMLYDELKDKNITLIKLLDEVNGEGTYCIEEKLNTYRVFKRTLVPDGYLLYGYCKDETLYYYDLIHYVVKEKVDFVKELNEVDADSDASYEEEYPALPPRLVRQVGFTIEQVAENSSKYKCVIRD